MQGAEKLSPEQIRTLLEASQEVQFRGEGQKVVLYEALNGVRDFLGNASPECFLPLAKVVLMFKERIPLGQPSSTANNSAVVPNTEA